MPACGSLFLHVSPIMLDRSTFTPTLACTRGLEEAQVEWCHLMAAGDSMVRQKVCWRCRNKAALMVRLE